MKAADKVITEEEVNSRAEKKDKFNGFKAEGWRVPTTSAQHDYLHNNGLDEDQSAKDEIIDEFAKKQLRSGYSVKEVRENIVSGIKGFETKRKRAAKNNFPLHRPARSTIKNRKRKKVFGRREWFLDKKRDDAQESDDDEQEHAEYKCKRVDGEGGEKGGE